MLDTLGLVLKLLTYLSTVYWSHCVCAQLFSISLPVLTLYHEIDYEIYCLPSVIDD